MKPLVTITDVARAAAVSVQTVSRALNNKGEISPTTRDRIVAIAEQLGYRRNAIARGLVTNRSMTLGLLVPDIANPFFPDIARGIEDRALANGYNVFLCNTVEDPNREAAVLALLEEKRVDGIILCSARLTDDRLLPLLRRHRAVVLVNHPAPPEVAASVRVDDAAGTQQAVRHLHATQRTPIAFLAGPAHAHSSQQRTVAYRQTLAELGMALDPTLLRQCAPDAEGGYQAARALLAGTTPVPALLCYNDLVAVGALQACREAGLRVPDDVAIIGCDDIALARLITPALTTLRVDKSAIGAAAFGLLLARIEGDGTDAEVVFTPELVLRASAP
ncbi:MAG: LacI family DNA-binding transcriptional regulator [Ktedonobacterales bacterium]|nr:LacI family DNA-binding transcriptional regulator [Ktedonobacterales bacterium]